MPTSKLAHEIKRGDEVKFFDWDTPEFVRNVQIIVQMSNGMDVRLNPDLQIEVLNG